MPYSNIDKPSKYFDTKLYTGTGSSQSITGLSFSPDFVWIKDRTSANNHRLLDIIRGATKELYSSTTDAETTQAQSLTAFNSDGFTVGTLAQVNTNTNNYVSWNWDANGAGVSNNSGTITSTVSANTTSGFSIVSWTGNTSNSTIGHGLGVAPKMIIVKNRSTTDDWTVQHVSTGATQYLALNKTDASASASSPWNNTTPTSSLFSVGTYSGTNGSGNSMIAYCFAEVKGFSKFGSYTGNGSTDGTFIYTGFKPAFVMVKASSTTGQWAICDTKRGVAPSGEFLFAEDSGTTNSAPANWDFLSNGFKARANYAAHNTSGVTHIYMAFAENPFVSSKGIPTCAR